MIPELRERFNRTFTPQRYQSFLARLDERCRTKISFRVCETPLFVPRPLQLACEQAAVELTLQAHDPAYLRRSDRTLRPEHTVANQPDRSTFMTVDFALTPGPDGTVTPKLVELQGFPSLMGFQLFYAELMQEHYALPPELRYINGDYSRSRFVDLMRRAIVADEDPENVVLLELDPWNQKTVPDFIAVRELLGIAIADIRHVRKLGRRLHYEDGSRLIPIHRIYNRAIVDEIERTRATIPFNWHDDLDVTWAGHPNWYFRISKFTLPFLDHPTVPRSLFLSELDALPEDLNRWVLKPLYSFAGAGVIVGPSPEDIGNIPPELIGDYILQERVEYGGVVKTPEGATKAELRVMLIWLPDEERPRPVMGLVRMGRGKLMGVSYNSDLRWIGAGCNFFEPPDGA
jgi:hypothetical protein